MNLLSARVVLRPRPAADVLDLAAPYCIGGWRVLLPLAGLVLLPAAAACWLAHTWLHWTWPQTWLLAVALIGLAEAPFTIACGELLFQPPRQVRVAPIIWRTLRRSPAFLVAHLTTQLALVASAFVLLIPLPFAMGGLLVVPEAVLLEGAGPFAALARSGRAVRGQGIAALGIAVVLVLLPAAGLIAGELAGQTLIGTVFQLGEPFGDLWKMGGSPYALVGFFATVPLVAAARFLKYTDLRTRKEGWDIQLRFMAIARAAAEPDRPASAPRAAGALSLSVVLLVLLAPRLASAAPAPEPEPATRTSTSAPAAVPETPSVLPVDDAVARSLASPRYRFCADEHYPLLPREVAWCAHLPRSPDPHATRCPGLLGSCKLGPSADEVEPPKWKFQLPDFGGLGQLLFWALVVGAAGGLIYVLVRAGLLIPGRMRRSSDDDGATLPAARVEGPAPRDEEVERDVERLLARARAAAAAGDFSAAVVDLHAALFRRLEGEGHVRIHSSATNGDYLRELVTRAPHLAPTVGEAVRDVEIAEFAATGASEGLYLGLLGRIGSIVRGGGPAPLALLLLAGTLSALLAACGGGLRADWPASPSGSAAVLDVLNATGIEARERLAPLTALIDSKDKTPPSEIVLLPGAELDDKGWEALKGWLGDPGRTLVLAMNRTTFPAWLTVEVVSSGGEGPLRLAPDVAETTTAQGESRALASLRGWVPGGAWLRADADGAAPLLMRGKRRYATAVPNDVGRVFALADDGLLTNAALVVDDNAALLVALLRYARADKVDKPVLELVGQDTGVLARTPIASVSRGRLAPFLLQLAACLVLFLLMQGRAFGRLIDPEVTRRRLFSEHVRALGTQYGRARASARVLSLYSTWAVERLRERIRLPGDRSIGDLAAAVAARTGRPMGDVARVLFAAPGEGEREGVGAPAASPGGGVAVTGAASAPPDDTSRVATRQHLSAMRDLGQLVVDVSGAPPGRGKLAPRKTADRIRVQTGTHAVPRTTTSQIAVQPAGPPDRPQEKNTP